MTLHLRVGFMPLVDCALVVLAKVVRVSLPHWCMQSVPYAVVKRKRLIAGL